MKCGKLCFVGCTIALFAIVSCVFAQEVNPRTRAEGRGRGGPPGFGQPAPFETATVPKDDAEKKILDTLDEITRTQGRMMNVWRFRCYRRRGPGGVHGTGRYR